MMDLNEALKIVRDETIDCDKNCIGDGECGSCPLSEAVDMAFNSLEAWKNLREYIMCGLRIMAHDTDGETIQRSPAAIRQDILEKMDRLIEGITG